ncbi:MAG: hypothetical protein ACQES2_11210 [Pseudomonadota bacterium]
MNWARDNLARPILLLVLGGLFAWSQAAMLAILQSGQADGLLIALQTTFSAERFTELTDMATVEQKLALAGHFRLDVLHPLWYGGFALCLGCLLFNLNGISERWHWVLWLAPVMGLCDMLENALHMGLLGGDLAIAPLPVFAAGLFATTKWTIAASYTLVMLGLIPRAAFSRQARPRGH